MPVLFIAPQDHTFEKVLSNMKEVHARKGSVICITDHRNVEIDRLSDSVVTIPSVDPIAQPILAAVPIQMIAYHIAIARGEHVDKPRHQTKVFSGTSLGQSPRASAAGVRQ